MLVLLTKSFCAASFARITKNQLNPSLPWLVLGLILAVSFWLRGRYLWTQDWNSDEGQLLMFALLTNAGYPPYTVTYVDYPPLALLTIQLGIKLFETTLAARYPMMLFSLLGIGGLFWLFRPSKSLTGLLAGLLAAVFLSFQSDYFQASGSLLVEAPAVALAILSLALAQQYGSERKLFWLILSGLAFSMSLALKIFVVFLPILVGLLLVFNLLPPTVSPQTYGQRLGRLVIAACVWLLGVVLLWGIWVILYNPQVMYQHIFAFRFALREVMINLTPAIIGQNVVGLGRMVAGYSPWIAGAILGVILAWRQRRLDVWLWLIWLILAAGLLIWQVPLRGRYSIILLPPLVALSGLAVAYSAEWFLTRSAAKPAAWVGQAIVIGLLMGLSGWMVVMSARSAYLSPSLSMLNDTRPERLDAIAYVRANTTPTDFIVTDDQRFAVNAGRLVPPALTGTSHARLLAGGLALNDVLSEIGRYECPLVIYADQKFIFDFYFPKLQTRLHDLYYLKIIFNQNTVIYTGKKQVMRQPDIPLEVQLNDMITLKGLDLTPSPWRPGQEMQLAAYWVAFKPLDRDYKIFVQLQNGQHETVVSADHFPFPASEGNYQIVPTNDHQKALTEAIGIYPTTGMLPTRAWPVNTTIREVTTLKLPAALPGGTYHLYLGMYDPATLIRLPIQNNSGERDEFLAASIEVIEAN